MGASFLHQIDKEHQSAGHFLFSLVENTRKDFLFKENQPTLTRTDHDYALAVALSSLQTMDVTKLRQKWRATFKHPVSSNLHATFDNLCATLNDAATRCTHAFASSPQAGPQVRKEELVSTLATARRQLPLDPVEQQPASSTALLHEALFTLLLVLSTAALCIMHVFCISRVVFGVVVAARASALHVPRIALRSAVGVWQATRTLQVSCGVYYLLYRYLGGYLFKRSVALISMVLDCVMLALVCRRALSVLWNHSQSSIPLSFCLGQRRFSVARRNLAGLLRLSITFLNLTTYLSANDESLSQRAARPFWAFKWLVRSMVALHVLDLNVSVQVAHADRAVVLSFGTNGRIRLGSPGNSSSCRSYRGYEVSCYELQRAREFNYKVMPLLREAPYSKVCWRHCD